MGANFETATLSGLMTMAEVTSEFARMQDSDRYENGHSYSGGFGMATGIEFPGKEFADANSATNWLDENCQKWESAKAVKFKTTDGTAWMIGAICAS